MELKDLGKLMGQVPQAKPVNILLKKGYWAIPFRGKWLGLYDKKVPAIHELEKIQLVEGQIYVIFSDGTHLPLYGVFGWEDDLQTIERRVYSKPYREDYVYLLGKEGLIEGLDFPAYEKLYEARQAVAEAEKSYAVVLNELGVSREWQGDQYDGSTEYSREGIPSWTVW